MSDLESMSPEDEKFSVALIPITRSSVSSMQSFIDVSSFMRPALRCFTLER